MIRGSLAMIASALLISACASENSGSQEPSQVSSWPESTVAQSTWQPECNLDRMTDKKICTIGSKPLSALQYWSILPHYGESGE